MLFNSYGFIFLFLPIALFGMFWLGRYSHRLAALWLGLASLSFYAVWDSRFVLLLLASICFNYGAGYWIGLKRGDGVGGHAKRALVFAIGANLCLLAYFKYANFFLASFNELFGMDSSALDIILPLGISFFTFTQIAFLVDVYRGIAREYNFIHYLLFVTYFPHLIAGPVLHHKQMMPQFALPETYRVNWDHVSVGLTIFILGLAKKVLIADNMSGYATPVFDIAMAGGSPMLFEAWIGSLAYTLQLYFDFSAYSDMAIGLSLMFNVRLPVNFDSPYKATNIIEFWRRWHMTLSAFLRDYLYIPLGGNRKGVPRRYMNLMLTMLLGGLWHGAGWTFVVWGGLHGFYLMVNHAWRAFMQRMGWKGEGHAAYRFAAGGLTFVCVVIGWVFFRADSFASALSMLHGMAGLNGVSLPAAFEGLALAALPATLAPYVRFDGIVVLSGFSSFTALATIFTGLLLVWFFPNVRQLLISYKPAWEDMVGKQTPAPVPDNWIARKLIWRPTRLTAVACGVLFFYVLISMASIGKSEFLYFQF